MVKDHTLRFFLTPSLNIIVKTLFSCAKTIITYPKVSCRIAEMSLTPCLLNRKFVLNSSSLSSFTFSLSVLVLADYSVMILELVDVVIFNEIHVPWSLLINWQLCVSSFVQHAFQYKLHEHKIGCGFGEAVVNLTFCLGYRQLVHAMSRSTLLWPGVGRIVVWPAAKLISVLRAQ